MYIYIYIYVYTYVHECVCLSTLFEKNWRIYRYAALLICNKNGVIFRLVLLLTDKFFFNEFYT